jgi:hypothetical protein
MVASDEGISYKDLLYVRRRYIQKDALREATNRLVNATFATRMPRSGVRPRPPVQRIRRSSAPGTRT